MIVAAKYHDASLLARFIGPKATWPVPTSGQVGRHLKYLFLWALVEAVAAVDVPKSSKASWRITAKCQATVKLLVEHPQCEWWHAASFAPLAEILALLAPKLQFTSAATQCSSLVLDAILDRHLALKRALLNGTHPDNVNAALDAALRLKRIESVKLLLKGSRERILVVSYTGVGYAPPARTWDFFPSESDDERDDEDDDDGYDTYDKPPWTMAWEWAIGACGSIELYELIASDKRFKAPGGLTYPELLCAAVRAGNVELLKHLLSEDMYFNTSSLAKCLVEEHVAQCDLRIPRSEFRARSLKVLECLLSDQTSKLTLDAAKFLALARRHGRNDMLALVAQRDPAATKADVTEFVSATAAKDWHTAVEDTKVVRRWKKQVKKFASDDVKELWT
ncbi:hypothetical protein H9P43_008783 [Blastocladiella emersonii ATCC 22665]|nr:hypothetical protein H9P43_008783 [Blastocladiella emersonii ATCC 22665]